MDGGSASFCGVVASFFPLLVSLADRFREAEVEDVPYNPLPTYNCGCYIWNCIAQFLYQKLGTDFSKNRVKVFEDLRSQ